MSLANIVDAKFKSITGYSSGFLTGRILQIPLKKQNDASKQEILPNSITSWQNANNNSHLKYS